MSEIRIPGYKIFRQLGQGGMSTVYLAEQLSFGRHVALKVMSAQLADEEQYGHRFLREARIAANLSHPNIVPVYDTGADQGNYFLAMEYLEGGDLRRRLRSGVALLESLDIVQSLADAVDYAASKGIVHRDIKPGNIMFREDGSVAIVDFGIAHDLQTVTNITLAGQVVGTPHYMSPEQSAGEELDSRSDLYSLGILLYEVLTGRVPFSADSAAAVVVMHLMEEPPELTEKLQVFQSIMDRILEKSPEDRYQTGAEFAADIEAVREEIPDELNTTILLSKDYLAQGSRQHSRSRSRSRSSSSGLRRLGRRSIRPKRYRKGAKSIVKKAARIGSVVVVAVFLFVGTTLLLQAPGDGSLVSWIEDVDIFEAGDTGPATAVVQVNQADLSNSDGGVDDDRDNVPPQGFSLPEQKPEGKLEEANLNQSQQAIGAIAIEAEALHTRIWAQIASGELYYPSEDNAFLTLADLRFKTPYHPELSRLQKQLYSRAQKKIDGLLLAGDVGAANREFALLKRVANASLIAPLSSRLEEQQELAAQRAEQLERMLVEASVLEASARPRNEINHELIKLYKQILSFDSRNRTAVIGLRSAGKIELDYARSALGTGKLDVTRKSINFLNANTPQIDGLVNLESDLLQVESTQLRVLKKVEGANSILDGVASDFRDDEYTVKQNKQIAKRLLVAYRSVLEAVTLSPDTPDVRDSLSRVEREYLSRFNSQMAYMNHDGARIYLEELESTGIDTQGSKELIEKFTLALDKTSKSRNGVFPSF